MTRMLSLILCVALTVPGCASARGASNATMSRPPQTPADPAAMAAYVRKLPVGSRVRVDTAAGRTVHGTLIDATDERIVVQRNTRIPVPPDAIPVHDLSRVTPEAPSSNGKLMVVGAAIGAGAAIGVIWLIALFAFSD
jgi:hypothetical protein